MGASGRGAGEGTQQTEWPRPVQQVPEPSELEGARREPARRRGTSAKSEEARQLVEEERCWGGIGPATGCESDMIERICSGFEKKIQKREGSKGVGAGEEGDTDGS